MKGFATLHEMRENYCLEDVFDMHTAIALQNKIEERKRSE